MPTLQQTSSSIHPMDVITGIGIADRKFIITLIALFEVSRISRQVSNKLGELAEDIVSLFARIMETETTYEYEESSIESRVEFWSKTRLSDNELRVVLWIYIREALGLCPKVTISTTGLAHLADEIASAALQYANNEGIIDKLKRFGTRRKKKEEATTLDDITGPVIQEMMELVLDQLDTMNEASREAFYSKIKIKLDNLSPKERKLLLDSVGSTRFNDVAIRRILTTSGGLVAFGGAVEVAGFSAYILAAQLSAFIPLVSGPGLVSFVAVLSNPLTIIGGAFAASYFAVGSASKKVSGAIAIRTISLLAMLGMSNRKEQKKAHKILLESYPKLIGLNEVGDLNQSQIDRYANDWDLIRRVLKTPKKSNFDSKLELWLDTPIRVSSDSKLNEKIVVTQEELEKTALVTGLTIGDVLFNLYSIDPSVILASDFARSQEITSRFDFATFADEAMRMAPTSINGTVSNLKGYVSEQVVVSELASKGHHVELPTSANNVGWDIKIDGDPFQIKNSSSVSAIRQHFDKYDYPIIANTELAGKVPAEYADQVYFVEGFSNEIVEEFTRNSLESGANVFAPDVPLFAGGISAAYAYKNYRKGYITANQAWEQVVLDGFSRSGLAVAGGLAGAGIGLLVFGPAGALVWGILAPVMAQSQTTRVTSKIKNSIKTSVYRQWERGVSKELDLLEETICKKLDWKIETLRQRYSNLGKSEIETYIKKRITDQARGLQELKIRLKEISKRDIEIRIRESLSILSRSPIHPIVYQVYLHRIAALLKLKPTINEQWEKLRDNS
jgi:hypothetical protein